MNFDDRGFYELTKDIKQALEEVCKKHQVKLVDSKVSYGLVEFDMKLTFQKNEEGLDVEAINFAQNCFRYGFKPSDYKRVFEHIGVKYELLGFDTNAKKYNCIVRDLKTGGITKVNSDGLASILKNADSQEFSDEEKKELDDMPAISEEEMSAIRIKLGKSKLNAKDFEQVYDIFKGKMIFTFKVKKANAFLGSYQGIAEEDEMLSIFTSVEACTKHLDELTNAGIISGKINVVGMAFDDIIRIADAGQMDVIIDNSAEAVNGCFGYSGVENCFKIID